MATIFEVTLKPKNEGVFTDNHKDYYCSTNEKGVWGFITVEHNSDTTTQTTPAGQRQLPNGDLFNPNRVRVPLNGVMRGSEVDITEELWAAIAQLAVKKSGLPPPPITRIGDQSKDTCLTCRWTRRIPQVMEADIPDDVMSARQSFRMDQQFKPTIYCTLWESLPEEDFGILGVMNEAIMYGMKRGRFINIQFGHEGGWIEHGTYRRIRLQEVHCIHHRQQTWSHREYWWNPQMSAERPVDIKGFTDPIPIGWMPTREDNSIVLPAGCTLEEVN